MNIPTAGRPGGSRRAVRGFRDAGPIEDEDALAPRSTLERSGWVPRATSVAAASPGQGKANRSRPGLNKVSGVTPPFWRDPKSRKRMGASRRTGAALDSRKPLDSDGNNSVRGSHAVSTSRERSRVERGGELSGGGRMEDRGPFAAVSGGRLVDGAARRRGEREGRDAIQDHPLIGAVGVGDGRRRGQWDSVRTTRARAGRGAFRPRPIRGVLSGVIYDRRGTLAEDQRVEPREIGQSVGLRHDEMVAGCPGGARRTEAVDQEQQECSGPPPPQSFGTIGPHRPPRGRVGDLPLARANPDFRVRTCHLDTDGPSLAGIT